MDSPIKSRVPFCFFCFLFFLLPVEAAGASPTWKDPLTVQLRGRGGFRIFRQVKWPAKTEPPSCDDVDIRYPGGIEEEIIALELKTIRRHICPRVTVEVTAT